MNLVNKSHNNTKKVKKQKVLKRSKLGFEIEMHVIDDKGRIQSKAPQVIKTVKEIDPKTPIIKECAKHFIELNSHPDLTTYNSALDMVNSLKTTIEGAEKLGLKLYPFGTYPLAIPVQFQTGEKYELQEKIFGKEKFGLATYSAGFHCHYTMPKGVFDEKSKSLKFLMDSKFGRSFIGSYNFSLSIDPAMTLFAQSSPFYKGQYISKDMKNLIYRGGKKLGFPEGVYTKSQMLGSLPPYKMTMTDLMTSLNARWKKWKRLTKKADPNIDIDRIYPYHLDISWNPVKINKVGTIEHRSMDTNFMSINFAIAVIFKFCLKKIQTEFLEVMPADFAIKEPFKIENGILYIPPQSYVRNKLQLWSIYKGFAHKEMHFYAKKLLSFAKMNSPNKYHRLLNYLEEMVESKKSVSDKILQYAKYKGYLENNKISTADACELSLYYAELFPKDLDKVEKLLQRLSFE